MENHIFDLYEADINPICRFTDLANLKGSGWIKIKKYSIANKSDNNKYKTICKYDIKTNWKNVKALDRDVS